MKPVFADTYFFLAVLNARDSKHAEAVALSKALRKILTTEFVLTEVADGLADTPGRRQFESVIAGLRNSATRIIVPATPQWFRRGADLYRARADKEWSLTDCISFEVMRDENLTEALTADHHFEQAGFIALLR